MSATRRSFILGLLGIWLGITLCTITGAVMSFGAAGARRGVSVETLAPEARAQAARFNASMFVGSGAAQMMIAALCVFIAILPPRDPGPSTHVLLVASLITMILACFLVPRTIHLGQELIAGTITREDARVPMQRLHLLYASLDLVKALLVVVAFTMVARRARELERA